MARVINNNLAFGARGNVGKQFVYKKRGKRLHIAAMPEVNENLQPTEKQEKVRNKFASASRYATGALASADIKKEYERKATARKTAFNVAFKDYLHSPSVKLVDTELYDGTVDSVINIDVQDDFKVVEVLVHIQSPGGALLETGKALIDPINTNRWSYTAKQANPSMTGSIIKVTALDLPGNKGKLELTI